MGRQQKFYVGVDGCKRGWLAIKLVEGGDWEVSKPFGTINQLWQFYKDASLILIDIPIGLPDNVHKERLSDSGARDRLGKRHVTVFPTPCREAVYAVDYNEEKNYEKVKGINKDVTGKGLNQQSWRIARKIKEVDEFLQNNKSARQSIRETHPEVCFWALAGRAMEHSKGKLKGYFERLGVLMSVYPNTPKVIKEARERYPLKKDFEDDDILDALVAVVTAYKSRGKLKSIPEKPQTDSTGLPMQIIYYPSKT